LNRPVLQFFIFHQVFHKARFKFMDVEKMKGVAQVYLIVAFLALVGAAVVLSPSLGLGTQSIVAVSNVQYDDGSKMIVALATVDSGFTTDYIPAQNFSLFNQSILSMKEGVRVKFNPFQPFCKANAIATVDTFGGILGLGTKTYTYYTLTTFERHVPYELGFSKTGLLDNVFAQGETRMVDVALAGSATSEVFKDVDGKGSLFVKNLGQLDNGVFCPSVSDTILLQSDTGKWELKSKAQYDAQRKAINDNWLNLFSNDPVKFIGTLWINNFKNLGVPAGYAFCQAGTTCTSGVLTSDPTGVVYNLPYRSASALVTISGDADFYNAVIVSKEDVRPKVSLALNNQLINQGDWATLTVTVSNVGSTSGMIAIRPTTLKKLLTFTPTADGIVLNPQQSGSKVFTVNAYSLGGAGLRADDQLCVTAEGSSGFFDTTCIPYSVLAPVPTQSPVDKLLGVTPQPTVIATIAPGTTLTPQTSPAITTPVPVTFYVCPNKEVVASPELCKQDFKVEDWMILAGILGIGAIAVFAVGGKRRK
jgi:hypothetical protein